MQPLVPVAVTRVRHALRRLVYARTLLVALAAVLLLWMLADGVQGARGGAATGAKVPPVLLWVALVSASLVAWWLARRRVRDLGDLRAALWIEERGAAAGPAAGRAPSFALVTLVEAAAVLDASSADTAAGSAVRSDLRAVVDHPLLQASAQAVLAGTDIPRALQRTARHQLLGPALFVAGACTVLVVAPALRRGALAPTDDGVRAAARTGGTPVAVPPLGAWRVRVAAPAYTRLAPREFGDVSNVSAVRGSVVQLRGSGPRPDRVLERVLERALAPTPDQAGGATDTVPTAPRVRALVPTLDGDGWQVRTVATDGPVTVELARGGRARLLVIEGRADSIPVVTLLQPARDSVFRTPVGRLALVAALRDDIGLSQARFELIVTSGEGERFTARTVVLGATTFSGDAAGTRRATVRATMDLTGLALAAGDIVHLRAIARDAHPSPAREYGSSETRSFRIARAAEYDSVAVEPAPPPEVDRSLLSQRMLLLLTEKLVRQRPVLTRRAVLNESMRLARDQARLRQAVGDVVFQRLSGDVSGEHAHSAGDGHDHGVEQQQGKLALTGGNAGGVLEEGDDSPVIAINQPLLEAYNAMWDAGRALEQGEPAAAIPPMRLALAAIERARAASRLYLRGTPPTVIIDLAKVRLAGKDTGVTNARRAREAMPPREARRADRLVRAAQLAARDGSAARDSLAVLRADALGDAPAFAAAVSAVLDALNTGADATDAFVRARRVLGVVTRTDAGVWSRGGPP